MKIRHCFFAFFVPFHGDSTQTASHRCRVYVMVPGVRQAVHALGNYRNPPGASSTALSADG